MTSFALLWKVHYPRFLTRYKEKDNTDTENAKYSNKSKTDSNLLVPKAVCTKIQPKRRTNQTWFAYVETGSTIKMC